MKSNSPSVTARMTATMRALHQFLPDAQRINTDPFAEKFVTSQLGLGIMKSRRFARWVISTYPSSSGLIAARDRFAEDWARRTLSGPSQVVLLGAGYDSVALRLAADFPETKFFEVDHPATQARKLAFLESRNLKLPDERCRFVASNFEANDLKTALLAAGFDPQRLTVVNWMGVTYYLHPPAIHQTLTTMSELLSPGSLLLLDFFYEAHQLYNSVLGWFLKQYGEPIVTQFNEERIATLAREHSFEPVEIVSAAHFAARYSTHPSHQHIRGGLAAFRRQS